MPAQEQVIAKLTEGATPSNRDDKQLSFPLNPLSLKDKEEEKAEGLISSQNSCFYVK